MARCPSDYSCLLRVLGLADYAGPARLPNWDHIVGENYRWLVEQLDEEVIMGANGAAALQCLSLAQSAYEVLRDPAQCQALYLGATSGGGERCQYCSGDELASLVLDWLHGYVELRPRPAGAYYGHLIMRRPTDGVPLPAIGRGPNGEHALDWTRAADRRLLARLVDTRAWDWRRAGDHGPCNWVGEYIYIKTIVNHRICEPGLEGSVTGSGVHLGDLSERLDMRPSVAGGGGQHLGGQLGDANKSHYGRCGVFLHVIWGPYSSVRWEPLEYVMEKRWSHVDAYVYNLGLLDQERRRLLELAAPMLQPRDDT